jgi:hydrogenase nickel incorporation protein HypA/HybF
MHELSIAQSLLGSAIAAAAEHQARRITVIRLRIGGLRQVVEESLRQAFDLLAEGSIAEHAALDIDWVPSVWRCARCGHTLALETGGDTCPCGSRERRFEGSDDLLLTSLELERDDED